IDLLAGQIRETAGDGGNGEFILNASAARRHGWTPQQAVGQPFELFSSEGWIEGRIAAVAVDSNFESAYFDVKPLLFVLGDADYLPSLSRGHASLRLTGDDPAGTLAAIDRTWNQVLPELPVNRRFLGDSLDALYQDDRRLGEMFN